MLIGSTNGQDALQKIADSTGGKFYYAAIANEIRKSPTMKFSDRDSLTDGQEMGLQLLNQINIMEAAYTIEQFYLNVLELFNQSLGVLGYTLSSGLHKSAMKTQTDYALLGTQG